MNEQQNPFIELDNIREGIPQTSKLRWRLPQFANVSNFIRIKILFKLYALI